ncbi:hypothetical protein FACS1894105_13030 [Clostridia bacterium]|nr:hypothetical protein FACS1894105_13030 [Clostridia bacterium]
MKRTSSNIRIILIYVALIAAIIFVASYFLDTVKPEKVTYGEIVMMFKEDRVSECIIDENNAMRLTLTDNRIIDFKLRDLSVFYHDIGDLAVANLENKSSNLTKFDILRAPDIAWWVSFLPYIIVIVLFVVIWFVFMNQAAGGKGGKIASFGKAKTKQINEEQKKVFFADVAGADEEKEELREVVDFLKNPLKFVELGARIPRGVLLVGPPGTGKTLLAKAVAGEAGVPFYSISGSDFVEMYVGVGASRVRDLFDTAKKTPASIIFIDEIDAVGRHRGAGLGGGHDEREQTLNQLLVEMDGFGSNEGVIVIAATNRPDILDPALLRPGRFDRQVTVNYPDIKGREEILKVHAKSKPFEAAVKLDVIAKSTSGFTGADLANLLNEAALTAARKMKKLIGMNDIEEAMLKVMMGPQKKTKVISEHEKKLVAYHEAGHAIVTFSQESSDPVHQISIIPTGGGAGGYTMSLPKEDRNIMSKNEMQERIVTLLGGRVAEELVMKDISTGASNDIQRVSQMARRMIMQYGMSETLGPIVFGTGHEEVFLGRELNSARNYSEKVAAQIDDEVRKIVEAAQIKAKAYLQADPELKKLHFIAEFLLKYEVMDGEQFKAAMEGEASLEKLEAMVADKKKVSDDENKRVQDENERRAREESARRDIIRDREHTDELGRARAQSQKTAPPYGSDYYSDDDDDQQPKQ